MTEKKSIKIHTEIVNGICPTCEEYTMLVGITRSFYRCMTCGADLEQHVNGSIKYIPYLHLSLIHISEPTRQEAISYAVFCLKNAKKMIISLF